MVWKLAVPVRTLIVRVTIGSFFFSALLGVLALIAGDAFGPAEARDLLTTLLVGVSSVAVLCYLATAGTPYQWVGVTGGVVLVAPVATGLAMIWQDYEHEPAEPLSKTFIVGMVVAATLAHASLLLALGTRSGRAVRGILAGTLVLAGVLAGLLTALVLWLDDPGSLYLRLVGVVVILDALGSVVIVALARFGPGAPRPAEPPHVLTLSPLLAVRVAALAERTGHSAEAVLEESVERYLAVAEAPVTVLDETR